MKKITDIEMKVYEFLGIKKFKGLIFLIVDKLITLSRRDLSKEERKKIVFNTVSNYNIGKDKDLNALYRYKKLLYFNIFIHIISYLTIASSLSEALFNNLDIIRLVILIILETINTYCLILQRYNWIRINKTIKRMITKQELEEKKLKEELIEKDSLLEEDTYKVIDELNVEKTITFKDLIDKADINTLKEYRKYLAELQENIQNNPLMDSKGVKLVLKYGQDR